MPFLTKKNTTSSGANNGRERMGTDGFDIGEDTSSQALKLSLCQPSRNVRFKDRIYFGSFICTLCVMVILAATIRTFLPPYKRLEEVDSWGNLCGVDNRGGNGVNSKYARDMRAQSRTFFTAKTETFRFLKHDTFNQYFVRLCVKECPRLAVKCEDFLSLNGYDGYITDRKVLDKRVCVAQLDVILPQKTQKGYNLICTPRVISLDSYYDNSKKTRDSQSMDWLSSSVLSSTDTIFYHKTFVGIFFLMALIVSYLFAFMLFFIPRFSPYYFALFSIHICLLSVIVCFYKINQINSVEIPKARHNSIRYLVDNIYYRDINNYVVGNETWLKSAQNMSISELEDISDVTGSYGGRKERLAYTIAAVVIIAFCVLMMLPEIFTLQEYYIDCATLMFQVLTSFHKCIPLVFAIPLITGMANFILYWYFTTLVYHLHLSHISERDADGVEIVNHTTPVYMYLLRTLTVLCILWVAEFCRGCEQFLIAGCVMDCYFDPMRGTKSWMHLAIGPQLVKLYGRSMGQIAFGSLIVIVFAPLRIILYMFHIFFSTQICNYHEIFQLRKAYLSVVLFGDGYKSAWNRTRALLKQHASYALETNYIMGFYIILVRISVTVMTTIGFIMITSDRNHTEATEVLGVPVFEIGFGAWFVCKSVLNVQHVSHNAMIYCFCVDMERNNGRELPYSSPKYMLKAMESLKVKVAMRQLERAERRKTIWGRLNFKTWRNNENEDTISNFTYHEGTSLAERSDSAIPEL